MCDRVHQTNGKYPEEKFRQDRGYHIGADRDGRAALPLAQIAAGKALCACGLHSWTRANVFHEKYGENGALVEFCSRLNCQVVRGVWKCKDGGKPRLYKNGKVVWTASVELVDYPRNCHSATITIRSYILKWQLCNKINDVAGQRLCC